MQVYITNRQLRVQLLYSQRHLQPLEQSVFILLFTECFAGVVNMRQVPC